MAAETCSASVGEDGDGRAEDGDGRWEDGGGGWKKEAPPPASALAEAAP